MKENKYLFLKVFIPFLLGFLLIGAVSFFALEKLNKKYEKVRIAEILRNIQTIYENKLKENYHLYNELIANIQSNKEISRLYLSKDRQKLYEYTKSIYKRLNKNFQVTHFYFHDLNSKNFLRVHNPSLFGDKINRLTLKEAIKTKDISYGIEFGVSHNLTSRYVEPYYINNKLVGYIELGEEIDYLTPYLAEALNAQILVAIKKDLIDLKNMKLTSSTLKRIKNYPETENYYVINSTIKDIGTNIKNLIDGNLEIIDAQRKVGNNYEIGKISLYDLEKKEVGELIVLINSKSYRSTLINLKTQLSLIILFIAFIIVSLYYFYLKETTIKLEQTTKNIIKLTNTDQLTGLYNRRYFNEKIPKEIKKAIREEKNLSFIMIDVDSFKLYNDNYGHIEGDYVLEEIAKTIKDTLKRSSDIAFRMGGEEFSIFIIEEKDKISANKIANILLKKINNLEIEHLYNKNHKKITVSIGFSTRKARKNLNIDTLYKEADIALYNAKNNGKNIAISYKEE